MTSQGQRFRRRALRRGYKVDEVDSFLDRVEATLAGEPIEHPVGADEVHDVVFRVRFGGYDEWQVDLHLDRVERQLAELAQQGPGPGPGPGPGFGPGPDARDPQGYPPERMGLPPGGPAPGPGAGPGGPPAAAGPPPMGAPGPGQGGFPPPGAPAPAYADSGYDRYEEPTYGGYDGHQPRPGHLSGGERFASDATNEMHLGDPGGRPMSPYGAAEPAPPAPGPGGAAGPGPAGPGPGAPSGGPPGMAGPPPGSEPGPGALPRRPTGPPPGGPPPGGPPPAGPPPAGPPPGGSPPTGPPPGGPPPAAGPPPGSPPAGTGGPGSPPPSPAPMSGMPAPGPGYSSGYGSDYGPPPDQGGYGPASGDLQRLDELRRGFQPRRFGSGYDRAQVDRLFDEVMAGVSGQGPLPAGEADLDPARFDLVPGGYFEAEVDRALHEVRDILRRR